MRGRFSYPGNSKDNFYDPGGPNGILGTFFFKKQIFLNKMYKKGNSKASKIAIFIQKKSVSTKNTCKIQSNGTIDME